MNNQWRPRRNDSHQSERSARAGRLRDYRRTVTEQDALGIIFTGMMLTEQGRVASAAWFKRGIMSFRDFGVG
jgi:hypothetical protein